jgi:hypothetical protein
MNTDTFFTIGCTHEICEDYACSNYRTNEGIQGDPFVVISDGCSSARHSDFGARILARSSLPYLKEGASATKLLHGTIGTSAAISRALNLHEDALAATLLAATVKDNNCIVYRFGDGVLALMDTVGNLEIRHREFFTPGRASGAPYYPRYELDSDLKAKYEHEFGHLTRETTWILDAGGEIVNVQEEELFYDGFSEMFFDTNHYLFIALISDGIASFSRTVETSTGRSNEPIPLTTVIHELLAFKGYKGRFVQRRGNKAFKLFAKLGWKNADDVSMGVISFE